MNIDNSLFWTSNKINSYSLKHTLPPSTLINGNEYKIRITIFNQADESITSDAEVFQTSSRPIVSVSTIGTVNTFSYNFTATYQQNENVQLRSYIVYLFDEKKNLLNKSDIKTSLPLEQFFTNLQTEKHYFIEFQATSTKGLTGTSGLIPFDVFYFRPKMNIDLSGKNIGNAGVELSWFVRQILGTTDGSQFIDNEKIDTTDGTKLWFSEGFTLTADFSLKVWLENPISKEVLILLRGENGTTYFLYDAVLERFILKKNINGIIDVWISNEVSGTSFVVTICQIGNQLTIQALTN